MKQRCFLMLLSLLLAACVAGCSIMPFEDPEEQRKEEAQVQGQNAAELPVIPSELLDADLTLDEQLTNDQGQTMASYSVNLPQFVVDEAKKGQSFQRINEYYQDQLTGCREDRDSLFTMAKEHYGKSWASAAADQLLYSTEMTYTLTDAPDGYVCVLRTYKLRDGSARAEVYRDAEVFLLDNGWRLTLEELFGSNYEEAEPLLTAGIRAWCVEQGMSEEAAAALNAEDFAQGFGMDADSLLFFLPPFTLSAADDQAHIVSLSLSQFANLLPENIELPAGQPEDATSPHSA
ncbi:MAG: hypothetical protein VB086_01025 [Clostridiaceae bacterium]|nr:hypothetical protein [Clostridiaceae bacterium]